MWHRTRWQRSIGMTMLPQALTRRLGRRAGLLRLAGCGVRYKHDFSHACMPRIEWEAATEQCTSTAELALQVQRFAA